MYHPPNLKILIILLVLCITSDYAAQGVSACNKAKNSSPPCLQVHNMQTISNAQNIFLPVVQTGPEGSRLTPTPTPTSVIDTNNAEWPMAGGNLQRTSWTPEEVRGKLNPLWYKQFEPYISQKVQIIAANGLLYISTANGLYALDAADGSERWVYPTKLPLGHSPTVHDGIVYVGGFDREIHAIDAMTGQKIWSYDDARAGFHTNPLAVQGKLFAGNRDGLFYAIHTTGENRGSLAWKYETGGPILFSAAFQDGVIFFASQDSHAYALNAQTGELVWKSEKLPGAGFRSWWPVVYEDRVIFSGGNNYRTRVRPGTKEVFTREELAEIYPNHQNAARGSLYGNLNSAGANERWVEGTPLIDAKRVYDYFEEKPWRRTVFVLNRYTGIEEETAPVLWAGTHSGNRYPPLIGQDNVLYQFNNYMSDKAIAGGQISGWQPGNPHISVISSGWAAIDEPHAYSSGGNVVYWSNCCDRTMGWADTSMPNTRFLNRYSQGEKLPGPMDSNRERSVYSYNLDTLVPEYDSQLYYPHPQHYAVSVVFGTKNGVYGRHGDTSPPIPYNGKVYKLAGNAVIAFDPNENTTMKLPVAKMVKTMDAPIQPLGSTHLQNRLENEVQKILDAGHLRPGYNSHGIFDINAGAICGDNLVDYWHNSSETIITLIWAMPFLSGKIHSEVKDYLLSEFQTYSPYKYNHIGWSGSSREIFDLPPDIESDISNILAPYEISYPYESEGGWNREGVWGRNPYAWYALWKYAELFGNADQILNDSKDNFLHEFNSIPSNILLQSMPYVLNSYIAGAMGYIELEKLTGKTPTQSIEQELERLLQLRINGFSKDSAYAPFYAIGPGRTIGAYCRTLNISLNYMYLVPELATYLRESVFDKVQESVDEYDNVAPYWFVSFAEESFAENAIAPLYHSQAVFAAKALILDEPGSELEKYLDVPGFARGDLYYIQKLIATLENYRFSMSDSPLPHELTADQTARSSIDIQRNDDAGRVAPQCYLD